MTPSAALARESTRFAWVSSERILSRKLLTSLNCMHVRFVPSIILLNKAASVEQYYRFTHADASAGNEGILEVSSTKACWHRWPPAAAGIPCSHRSSRH